MSERRIPYFDFYPTDFMHGVRGLSAQEVGVYTMVLCRIYEDNGPVAYNAMILSTYCGMRESTFVKTLEKLICLDKFQVADGMISNRRAMVEISSRANKLKINSKAGKASAQKRQQKQGNDPADVQRAFNHTDTDTDNSYAAGAGGKSVDGRMGELYAALGVTDETKSPGLLAFSEPIRWVAGGCDIDADILPALRAIAARGKIPRSWSYCSDAVFEARDRRVAPPPSVNPRQARSPPPGRRMNPVEAYISMKSEPNNEPASRTIDHRDVERVSANEPRLQALIGNLGAEMRRPFGSGDH